MTTTPRIEPTKKIQCPQCSETASLPLREVRGVSTRERTTAGYTHAGECPSCGAEVVDAVTATAQPAEELVRRAGETLARMRAGGAL